MIKLDRDLYFSNCRYIRSKDSVTRIERSLKFSAYEERFKNREFSISATTVCRTKIRQNAEQNAEQKCKVQHKYQLQQEIGNLLFRVMRMTTLLLALFI